MIELNTNPFQSIEAPPAAASAPIKLNPPPQSTASLTDKNVRTLDTILKEHVQNLEEEASYNRNVARLLKVAAFVFLAIAFATPYLLPVGLLALLCFIPFALSLASASGAGSYSAGSDDAEMRKEFVNAILANSSYKTIKDLPVTGNPEMESLVKTISELQSLEKEINPSNPRDHQLKKMILERELNNMLKGVTVE